VPQTKHSDLHVFAGGYSAQKWTTLITLRYTTVADYYFARRHIVDHFSALDP